MWDRVIQEQKRVDRDNLKMATAIVLAIGLGYYFFGPLGALVGLLSGSFIGFIWGVYGKE